MKITITHNGSEVMAAMNDWVGQISARIAAEVAEEQRGRPPSSPRRQARLTLSAGAFSLGTRLGRRVKDTQGAPANWVSVSSSCLAAVLYEPQNRYLTVRYTTGKKRRYHGVPDHVAADLLKAVSKGSFYNRHIKGVYPSSPA